MEIYSIVHYENREFNLLLSIQEKLTTYDVTRKIQYLLKELVQEIFSEHTAIKLEVNLKKF